MVKSLLLVCTAALLVESILSQCIGGTIGRPFDLSYAPPSPVGYGGYGYAGCGGYGLPAPDVALAGSLDASYGGGLHVISTSPIAPTGVVVTSENVIEGVLNLGGNLPFLGAVTLEGVFPSAGAGSVSYGCGDGFVGIVSEMPMTGPYGSVAPAVAGPLPYGHAVAGHLPYGGGLVDYGVAPFGGCGYGNFY